MKTWRLIFPERVHSTYPYATCDPGKTAVESRTFNLLEALAIDPADGDRTLIQCVGNLGELGMESFENNAEQLIRETDEAFQAIRSVPAEAKTATQGWIQKPIFEAIAQIVSQPRRSMRKEASPGAADPTCSIIDTQYAAKAKRKAFNRKKNLLSRIRDVRQQPSIVHPRWAFSDATSNLVDIFSGFMFNIEADEMLTPDRLRRWQMREEKKENDRTLGQREEPALARRTSMKSSHSDGMDESTPTEPFHSEAQSGRLATLRWGDTLKPPSPGLNLSLSEVPQLQRRSPTTGSLRFGEFKIPHTHSELELQNQEFPSPPPLPNRSFSKPMPPLTTIPEVSSLSFKALIPRLGRYGKSLSSLVSIQPPPKLIYLPSTSFTFTCRSFKQGLIRIERHEKELLQNEILDWTAFQMAISGMMEEISIDERNEIEWAADEMEVDAVLDWWTGYEFAGYGQMVQDDSLDEQKAADAMATKTHKRKSEYTGGTDKVWVEGEMQGESLKWTKRNNAESLPPNPMLDFVPISLTGKEEEIVPMGFNLGHDLGDFLNWELNYVHKLYVNG